MQSLVFAMAWVLPSHMWNKRGGRFQTLILFDCRKCPPNVLQYAWMAWSGEQLIILSLLDFLWTLGTRWFEAMAAVSDLFCHRAERKIVSDEMTSWLSRNFPGSSLQTVCILKLSCFSGDDFWIELNNVRRWAPKSLILLPTWVRFQIYSTIQHCTELEWFAGREAWKTDQLWH